MRAGAGASKASRRVRVWTRRRERRRGKRETATDAVTELPCADRDREAATCRRRETARAWKRSLRIHDLYTYAYIYAYR
jgi:hypothetical protein